jgi:ElaB/YqjD/DUF883 family membrane-anchored ribosome-binding protein
MLDKNSDVAQDVASSTREAADTAKDYLGRGVDGAREYGSRGYSASRQYADSARECVNEGYHTAREYASAGLDVASRMTNDLTDFVRREPWVAIAAALAVGYLASRIVRRLTI